MIILTNANHFYESHNSFTSYRLKYSVHLQIITKIFNKNHY